MNINFWFKRKRVQVRRKKRKLEYDVAISDLYPEELELFNKVSDIAKKNRQLIRFDPQSSEILIVLEHMLVTLKNQIVYIDNTSGFVMMKLPSAAYELLVKRIEKEAHSERLKLKYEAKLRIIKFLKDIDINE